MEQFSRFFSIPLQILCCLFACKSITSVLKSNAYKDRHISFILKEDQIPSFTSKRILYLQEYMQPVGHLVLPCNTFRMLVFSNSDKHDFSSIWKWIRCSNDVMNHVDCVIKRDVYPKKRLQVLKLSAVYNFLF